MAAFIDSICVYVYGVIVGCVSISVILTLFEMLIVQPILVLKRCLSTYATSCQDLLFSNASTSHSPRSIYFRNNILEYDYFDTPVQNTDMARKTTCEGDMDSLDSDDGSSSSNSSDSSTCSENIENRSYQQKSVSSRITVNSPQNLTPRYWTTTVSREQLDYLCDLLERDGNSPPVVLREGRNLLGYTPGTNSAASTPNSYNKNEELGYIQLFSSSSDSDDKSSEDSSNTDCDSSKSNSTVETPAKERRGYSDCSYSKRVTSPYNLRPNPTQKSFL